MTQFKDFNELFDPLVLPVNGKEYTIPPLSFEAGARVLNIVNGTEKMGDEEFFRLLLSDTVLDQMAQDGVPFPAIERVGRVALTDFRYGRDLAVTMWETGGDPKAIAEYQKKNAPNRAQRRSKSTAAARKTR